MTDIIEVSAAVPTVVATTPPLPIVKDVVPTPKKFTPEEIKHAEKIITQSYYRLHFRNRSGAIRDDITKEMVRELSVHWSDLLRVIPNYRWSTVDDIVDMIWAFEQKNIRNSYTRTRMQIVEGIAYLLECGVLEKK